MPPSSGSISLGPLFLSIFGIIGTLSRLILDDPNEKFYGKIPEMQNYRLDDICDELGPIVSAAYGFMEDDSAQVPEDLDDTDKATVATHDVITPTDHLSDLQGAIERYYEPPLACRRCRQARNISSLLFLVGTLLGAAPVLIDYRFPSNPTLGTIAAICFWLSLLALILGSVAVIAYLRYKTS